MSSLAFLLALSLGASALPPPSDEAATAGSLAITPPALIEPPRATYTPEALAAGVEGTVHLRLTLDEQGHPAAVEVVEGLGHGLDEAALEAMRGARFTPAMRAGVPVACQLEHAYVFTLPAPPLEPSTIDLPVEAVASEPAAAGPAEPPRSFETVIRGRTHAGRALVRSAEAVDVIDVKTAHVKADDLAEVLTRDSAVQVQRTGGMGSRTQLSLAGLGGDQVRTLLDGVPLDYSPFAYGLGNIPVSLIQQIEIFNGVVPVRLASDALGGAIHLRSDLEAPQTGGAVSLQAGSFDTWRGTARLSWLSDSGHVFARGLGYHDRTENDYVITAPVSDPVTGRVSPRRVHRQHDAYRASGGSLEVGLVDLPWAKRLTLGAYLGHFDKEIPHNQWMTTPYGEVRSVQQNAGVSLRYAVDVARGTTVGAIAGFNRRDGQLTDTSACVYDWYGNCRAERSLGGEIGDTPLENSQTHDTWYARLNLQHSLFAEGDLEATLGFDTHGRVAQNAYLTRLGAMDPLAVPVGVTFGFAGVSHRQNFWSERLENVVFVKGYLQQARLGEGPDRTDTLKPSGGVGDTLRLRLTRQVQLKASYERTTRMPRAEELFGDGAFLLQNVALTPESSHNANLGVELLPWRTSAGRFTAGLTGSLREVRDLVQLFVGEGTQVFKNVDKARSLAVHGALEWQVPGDWLSLSGTGTWLDFRNHATEGEFARFAGDRLPNKPWLQASGAARLRFTDVFGPSDAVTLEWNTRWVEAFFRSWESAGRASSKAQVPSQLLHFAALTYLTRLDARTLSFSLNVHNVTDADAFDLVGVQRPGRAVYAKLTIDL